MNNSIPLTRGLTALVSNADHAELAKYKWHISGLSRGYPYARRNARRPDGVRIGVWMHQVVMGGTPEGMVIDHINRNTLDNRRENLRFVSRSGNARNRDKKAKATSRFVGVHLRKRQNTDRPWIAYIWTGTQTRFIGSFVNELAAATARNATAYRMFGHSATMNHISVESGDRDSAAMKLDTFKDLTPTEDAA